MPKWAICTCNMSPNPESSPEQEELTPRSALPMGQACSAICLSLTAPRIVISILVALAAFKSGWILSNRSGKASANICWNCSSKSAKTFQYKLAEGRQTPGAVLKTELSDSAFLPSDENPPRSRKIDHGMIYKIIRPKNSSFWRRDLIFLTRGSQPRKFGLKSSI